MLLLFFAGCPEFIALGFSPISDPAGFSISEATQSAFDIAPQANPSSLDFSQQTNTGLTFVQDATPSQWSLS